MKSYIPPQTPNPASASVISREIPPGFEEYLKLKKKEIELLKTIPIESSNVAHVMNSELQRKYLTSVKRLMTYAQKKSNADPSKMVR